MVMPDRALGCTECASVSLRPCFCYIFYMGVAWALRVPWVWLHVKLLFFLGFLGWCCPGFAWLCSGCTLAAPWLHPGFAWLHPGFAWLCPGCTLALPWLHPGFAWLCPCFTLAAPWLHPGFAWLCLALPWLLLHVFLFYVLQKMK